MNKQAIEARRAYKRKWAKDNPEKIKAQQERYWSKKAEQAAAEQAQEQQPEQNEPDQGEYT